MLETIFQKGGPMTGPLLFCSFIAVTVIFERLVYWIRTNGSKNPDLCRNTINKIENAEFESVENEVVESADPAIAIMVVGVKNRDVEPIASMEMEARESVNMMNRRLPVLETLVTVAPLLGILGTVLGIIESFGFLGGSGVQNPEAITGGISEALFSTAGGLVVAILSLVFLNVYKNMTKRSTESFEKYMGQVLVALKKAER